MLIAHWLIVKLRVWDNCLFLRSESNQHLVVSSTHVRVSLFRMARLKAAYTECKAAPDSWQFLPGRVSTLVSWHLPWSSFYSFPPCQIIYSFLFFVCSPFWDRPGLLSFLDLNMLGQQWVSAVQAVDQPGVEQLIQIPLIRIGLRPKIFEGLPEDHSPLVNTVEFQLKARQDISTKRWIFWMTIISICTHLTISLRTWYRSQVPKRQLIDKQLLKWW